MPGQIVRLGGMTDCFQAAEIRHRATYAAIERLNEQKVGYLIVTKSPLVADDRYIAIMDRSLAHIQISVTSTDAEIAGMYERAAPPSLRFRAIEKLYGEGFDVTLRLSPCIPRFIDMERLERIRCDKILIEFLRVNT